MTSDEFKAIRGRLQPTAAEMAARQDRRRGAAAAYRQGGDGITQAELAGRLGVAPNTIYKWEKALRPIPQTVEMLMIGFDGGLLLA